MNQLRRYFLLAYSVAQNFFSKNSLHYIVEMEDWVIKKEGDELVRLLAGQLTGKTSLTHYGSRNKILHFGSIHTFMRQDGSFKSFHASNKIVVTWYHIPENDPRLPHVKKLNSVVDYIHTSCQKTKSTLIHYGVNEDKIRIIPLAVHPKMFFTSDRKQQQKLARQKLQLPLERVIIGSFQKDGDGWAEGLIPKKVKGPDIFCDLMNKLNQKIPIFVLLTGPARGYVKNRLTKDGVDFRHDLLSHYEDIVDYYHALDLYVITSREEGGPKALLESWASQTPLVSTAVGMVIDHLIDEENGFLCPIDGLPELEKASLQVLNHLDVRNKITQNGLTSIQAFEWKNMAQTFYQTIYRNLLCSSANSQVINS
jgi:glycosyltransferase involved in cell wall biosynthesis